MSLAKITIIGNVGRVPETKYTPNGALNVQFSIAASRKWRGADGQDQENTTWFRVTAWGKLAETLVTLTESGALAKGKQLYVEGRIEQREYTGTDGVIKTSLDVNATEVQLLGTRQDAEPGATVPAARQNLRSSGGYGPASGYGTSADDAAYQRGQHEHVD